MKIVLTWLATNTVLFGLLRNLAQFPENIQKRPELLIFMIIKTATDAYGKGLVPQYDELEDGYVSGSGCDKDTYPSRE